MTLSPTDTDLLTRLRQGEENAFALIYLRHVGALLRYTTARLGVREDAEEIVQEVFVSLWARHTKLPEDLVLHAYLFASAKYKIIRYISHQKVKQKYIEHFRLFEAVYDSTPNDSRDPEAMQELMEKSLNALPERCRQAVRLRLMENLSNVEIAERMRIGKSTVENYMVRAVKDLRRYFKGMSVME